MSFPFNNLIRELLSSQLQEQLVDLITDRLLLSPRHSWPDTVKRRPPTARRFYFTTPAVPWLYIFVTSHVLAHVANAPPVAAYPRYPPRRFVSFPSAAPTAPPGSAFLASPGCHRGHLDLDEPQPLAYTTLSNRPGADDDADGDASCQLRHSVLTQDGASALSIRETSCPPKQLLRHVSAPCSHT
jgi:hypothetical protein